MTRGRNGRSVVPGRVPGLALIPFAIPAGLSLLIGVGLDWPRDIAPGSGLKLPGLLATALTALVAWRLSVRGLGDPRVRRLSALLCLLVALLAWPIWSVGVLPSVNGAVLRDVRTLAMRLERTEATAQRHSPDFHHWAWLVPIDAAAGIGGGRHFISKPTYDRLTAERPATVAVDVATGFLGAIVVTAIR